MKQPMKHPCVTSALLSLFLILPMLSTASGADTNAEGAFQPDNKSLEHYQCPEWFRDAKFGIWAVWGPQSVPMQGDWYARRLYLNDDVNDKTGKHTGPDSGYTDHLNRYGHPSKVGFKDIIPLWKAEKWDPEQLMALYKAAGAKYFCMIAMHHDNFDCWNSPNHRWNSVQMGPHRDIAGEWQTAAQKNGLKFGMTEHLAASWWFYSAAHSADKTGPMAGVPYDGNDPKYDDLYWSGNENPSFHYYGTNVPLAYKENWLHRINDMVDHYHPDLLYSDSPLPYPDEVGRRMLAHYYNDNMRQHDGKLEAVYNCKEDSQNRWVQDLERGVKGGINPLPWQTDTCIGGWYYKTGWKYKSASQVIQMLADIVSKNGNLLLNFPLRPDGTFDSDELKVLSDLAAWMPINGEAIFATRPWKIFGEGPSLLVKEKGKFAGLKDVPTKGYSAEDIRFTQSKDGKTLYAIVLGVPGKPITIKALAGEKISNITLLGSDAKIDWKQTPDALVIQAVAKWPCQHSVAFKITLGK